jgi:hypothetical protein
MTGNRVSTCSELAHVTETEISRTGQLEGLKKSDIVTLDFLFRFHVSTILAAEVVYDSDLMDKIDYYQTRYERFNAFHDGLNDAAVVAKVEDACYGKINYCGDTRVPLNHVAKIHVSPYICALIC